MTSCVLLGLAISTGPTPHQHGTWSSKHAAKSLFEGQPRRSWKPKEEVKTKKRGAETGYVGAGREGGGHEDRPSRWPRTCARESR